MPSSKADTNPKSVENNSEIIDGGHADETIAAGDKILKIDRRQTGTDRRKGTSGDLDVGVVKNTRRKKERRRHIDPTTCERDYSDPELEFMRAMDDYKRKSGRMFPTCSEVLEVVRDLGYVQLREDQREALGLDDHVEEELELEDAEGDIDSEHEDSEMI